VTLPFLLKVSGDGWILTMTKPVTTVSLDRSNSVCFYNSACAPR